MLKEQFASVQKELANQEHTGQAGNGLVSIVMTGDQKIKSLKINPECVDPEDVEGLEDLIKAAFTEVLEKIEKASPGAGGGMPDIPGMGDLGSLLKGLG